MPDYSQGKIYKLYVEGLEDFVYIGSTTETLTKRLYNHRHQANSPTQKKIASCVMFEDDNIVKIELIESFPCSSKNELEIRERYWLEQFPDTVNYNTPKRDWKERWEINKEHNHQKHREWIQKNKEQQKEYKKNKRLENLEEARAKDKESNTKRKEARALWKKQKVSCCSCNSIMNIDSFGRHKKRIHPDLQDVSYIKITEPSLQSFCHWEADGGALS
jgi:hypothetical protein